MRIQKILIYVLFVFVFISCTKKVNEPEQKLNGELSINYQIDDYDHPITIWLEDENKNYYTTLFVCEWLSLEGYRNEKVCPVWSNLSNWGDETETIIDAVTRATPQIDSHQLVLDCEKEKIIHGQYNYNIEAYINGRYNILYSGSIVIGNEPDSSHATVTYYPSIYPDTSKANFLNNVSAFYKVKN